MIGFAGTRLAADYRRMQPGRKTSILRFLDATLANPGLLACFVLRIQVVLHDRGHIRVARFFRVLNNSWTGADLLPGCTIGSGLLLPHPTGIVVGHGAVIGRDCTILQNVTIGEKFADGRAPHEYPQIGDRVVVGAGAIILGNVKIGSDSSIAANSVVLSDVPEGSVVAGSPARIINSISK
jgi:serine O-acetyltransferase